MANVQNMKAQKEAKLLRLFTILLLVVGIAALALTVADLATKHTLLKLFGAKAGAGSTNFSGIGVADILLIMSSALLILGSIMQLVKNNYRVFQGTCIAAIVFALFPMIIFAVNIGAMPFSAVFTALALAIVVLAIFALKARWQVYIKEMTGEVKKLTWLNMKELIKATAVVLVFVLAFALLIYLLDLLFGWPIKALLSSKTEDTTSTTEPEPTAEPAAEPATEPEGEPATEPEGEPATETEGETATETEGETATETEGEPATETEGEPATETDGENTTEPAAPEDGNEAGEGAENNG